MWDGGRIAAAKEVARAESREQQAANDVDLYQLRSRVDQLFFSILLLEQQRDAIASTISLLDANCAKANSLLCNGVAMQSDVDAIEVEKLSAEQQLQSVESSIHAYRLILTLYTGADTDVALEEPTAIILPATNDASQRPEQLMLESRLATLDARAREVNHSVMPTIGAFAQGYYGYPGMNFMEAMISRDPSFNALVGVRVSWNVSSLYTKGNKLKIIDSQRSRINVAREVFDFNTDIQATQQRQELARLREVMESDARIVELRGRVRNASEAKLREGTIESTELLKRINDEKNAIIAANTHRIQYLMCQYQISTTLNAE